MKKYSVILQYVVEAEIEDVEANSEPEAIKKAREEIDANIEYYIADKIFKCTSSVEEVNE